MLDWNRFETLSGSDTENFEKLCRGVVRRHFSELGRWQELKNQPGVEFYIILNDSHPRLGKKDETVGWQNKWFRYKANGQLNSSGRTQILHSLDKTKEHVSQISHWFLWTHKTLAKADQDWYFGLQGNYEFTLHLWNQDDLDELLSGPALDLRNSYFGELALTNKMISEQHQKSIAPIKSRWITEVHQQMDAEHQVRRVLGEKEAWNVFTNIKSTLSEVVDEIDSEINNSAYSPWKEQLEKFNSSCKTLLTYCDLFEKDINGNDIEEIRSTLEDASKDLKHEVHKTLMKLRVNNLPLSLTVTNALAYLKDAKKQFRTAIKLLSEQLIAVIADAGGGKTQFSAELTAPSKDRSAGILILGRTLKSGMDLDDVAQNFIFYQKQVDNFEALISAINSLGERSGRRLPIVIDGLNEAQDPREWKHLLASTIPVLCKYPNVVLICTLRTSESGYENYYRPNRHQRHTGRESFADSALPESTFKILSEGFSEEVTLKAIGAYFEHYKIIANPFNAPVNFFSHPLNLKIFCDVTNRNAESEVQISYFPSSIYSLFREQIQHVIQNIVSMTNLTRKYSADEIRRALYFLGECLWLEGGRTINEDNFKNKISESSNDWDSDIVNLLTQEGLIFRDEGKEPYKYEMTPVYDRLGGFIVAEYLLESNRSRPLVDWASENNFIDKLFGELEGQHLLSQDIIHALVVLTPKTFHKQHLWINVPKKYRSSVLALSPLIDREDFCSETLENYRYLLVNHGLSDRGIKQLLNLKYVLGHPLNGEFFNEVLFNLSLADRDLSWTEYLRSHSGEIIEGLREQIQSIKSGFKFPPDLIRLKMIFHTWQLTSTVIDLRDAATELLYHLGRQAPESIFNLTIEFLNVNDPYVSERLLASSYAVATTLIDSTEYLDASVLYARNLYNNMFVSDAPNSTTHLLAREYASCTLRLINFYFPDKLKDIDQSIFQHPFQQMPRKTWENIRPDRDVNSRYDSPFRMDFENYTIGRLIKDRSNYDYSHQGYNLARGNILWRVQELGWSHQKFEKVEKLIGADREHFSGRLGRSSVERYGKKYSWIAYYELAGQFSDDEKLEYWGDERFKTDIDPFFPCKAIYSELNEFKFLSDATSTTQDWILKNQLPELSSVNEKIENGQKWTLLYGFITEESKKLDRSFYCSIHTAFLNKQDFLSLERHITENKRIEWPEIYSSSEIYSGELYCEALHPDIENPTLDIQVGHEIQQFDQPEIRIGDEVIARGGTVERGVPILKRLEIFPTITKYYWENSVNPNNSIDRLALSPWIQSQLDLRFDPTDFTYNDETGQIAVLNTNLKGDSYSNNYELIYLRSDLFELLLKKNDISFIKRISGERRYAKLDNLHGQNSYRQFEHITQ
jgi:hypothetical protein